MADHAPLSPSGSDLWMNCPGGAVLNEDVERSASEASAQGTVAHTIGYSMLTGGVVPEVGSVVQQDGFNITVDIDMIMHADHYAGYVRSLGGWQRYEQRVSLEWLVPGVWGTADAVIVNLDHGELHIIDFKYGAGVYVPVVENWQLMIYALAALGPDNWLDLKRVHMHIHQPRMNNVSMWTVPVDDLPNYMEQLVQAVNAVRAAMSEPEQHLSPGTHCRWCPQRATCEALQSTAITKAQAAFGSVETLLQPVIGEILDHAEMIDLWISAVRAEAYKRAERGECPGWKLVPKRPTRQWVNEDELRGEGVIAGVNVFGERPLLSPAQLEKTIGKRAFTEHFASMVTSISSGLKLVRESDAGTAVKADEVAALTFGAVQTEAGLLK
jgi:Protein of unknown function (DUF2800)